jgi:hypothetical protein
VDPCACEMVLEGLEHEALEAKKGFWADPQPGRCGSGTVRASLLEDAKIRYLRNSRGDIPQMALGKSHSLEALLDHESGGSSNFSKSVAAN